MINFDYDKVWVFTPNQKIIIITIITSNDPLLNSIKGVYFTNYLIQPLDYVVMNRESNQRNVRLNIRLNRKKDGTE